MKKRREGGRGEWLSRREGEREAEGDGERV